MASCSEAGAYWLAPDLIAWNAGREGDRYSLRYAPAGGLYPDEPDGDVGEVFALTPVSETLPPPLLEQFPHLVGYRTLQLDSSAGGAYSLHPVQTTSSDPVQLAARFEPSTGSFIVPARSTAVFVWVRTQ